MSFWYDKALAEMTRREWEALCDGCGWCCLCKLEDATGARYYTDVACRLLDLDTCRCMQYAERHAVVPDCVRLTQETVTHCEWLPATCAYRCLAEGRELPDWHPLVTGDPDSTRRAGMSVRGKAVSEEEASPLEEHVIGQIG